MDENKELVRRIQNGEDLFDIFVKKNEGLIYKSVHKIFKSNYGKGIVEYEDICNFALLHAYKAVMKFDLTRDLSVSTYLFPCVYFGILQEIRDASRKQNGYELYFIENVKKLENGEEFKDWHSSIYRRGFDEYARLVLELTDLISVLPLEQQQIFFLYYIQGMVQAEIGQEMKISQVKVSRHLIKIKQFLKEHYN